MQASIPKSLSSPNRSIYEKTAVQRLKAAQIREMIESPVYCDCATNPRWHTMDTLKKYILTHQARSCPDCNHQFRHVILIEKTKTVSEVVCSFRAFVLLLTSLLQYSILYYICFLAFVDVYMGKQVEDRMLLGVMTTMVLLVSICMNMRGIYQWAMAEMQANAQAKLIIDVIPDLQDTALVEAKMRKTNNRLSKQTISKTNANIDDTSKRQA